MLYDNFAHLCEEIGITPTKFTTDILKLSSSKVTAWKRGSIPKIEILQSIADYFGVSVGYLFDGGEKIRISELSENDKVILSIFKELTETQQGEIIGRAKTMAEKNNSDFIKKESVS